MTATLRSTTELRIGDLGEASVRVSFDPYLSVLALVTDAVGGRHRGTPEPWRRRLRAAVSPANARSVWPLVAPGHSLAPDCITPFDLTADTSVEAHVERLCDMSADEFHTDIGGVFGGEPPAHWAAVARRPRRWLSAHAATIAQAWSAMLPVWRQARSLLDREVERVGAASVRGSLDVVLGDLHPQSRFENGVLRIRDLEPAAFELAGRPIVLVPMLSGDDALICNLDRADAVWLGYPVPGVRRLFRGGLEPVRDDRLDLLLGPVRARVLGALARPLTMGELSARTGLAPSAITYHCDRLVAIGLLERERRGREVRVARTRRAERLADLFAD